MTWARQLMRRSWTYRSWVAGSKPWVTTPASHGRRKEEEDAGDRHQPDRAGQHGPPELVGGAVVALVVAEPAVDGHERRGQAGRDEDVEGDLRDAERRVVGVELGARAVRVGEDPVADDARHEVAERQDRQQDRAAREDAVDAGPATSR